MTINKNARTLARVTHTHTHTHRYNLTKEFEELNRNITTMNSKDLSFKIGLFLL